VSILKDHEAVPIENRPRTYGMCQQHKEEFMFFCGRCKTTLCISCKISGSHSSGEYANHKLMNIDEAYKDASDQSKTADPQTEKYKATLRNLLATVKDKIESVAKNAQATENELYERLREALDTLHKFTRAKISVLLADQLELQRRYDEIEWADNFLRFQYDVLEARDYLKSWFRHLEAKGEIIMVSNLEISEVEADLRVIGKIGVTFGPVKASDMR
jgi:B-box zinc finger